MKTFLTEAFQQMELIESNDFTFDADGATKLANFMERDMLDDFEAIIDPEAETTEDLKDSYVGDVVCECQICKSKIFKSPEDIKIDGEDAELVNVGECCPYCFETDGFKIIGQIAPYEEVTVETDGDADVKVEVDGEQVDVNTDDDELEPVGRHTKDNEDLEDSQRYPVEGTKQVDLTEGAERPLTNAEKLKKAYPELDLDIDENGYPINKDENPKQKSKRHAKDNEDLEDSQRYPIESPVGMKGLKEELDDEQAETEEDKKLARARKMRLARHKKDNEDLEDSQRYPIESPAPAQTGLAMMEGMSIRDKLEAAFPGVFNFSEKKEESLIQENLNEGIFKSAFNFGINVRSDDEGLDKFGEKFVKSLSGEVIEISKRKIKFNIKRTDIESLKTVQGLEKFIEILKARFSRYAAEYNKTVSGGDTITNAILEITIGVDASLFKKGKTRANNLEYRTLYKCELTAPTDSRGTNSKSSSWKTWDEDSRVEEISKLLRSVFESLNEGMEDISITTDDQVIKVKATPRADKEAIQPITDETKEVIETEEVVEEPVEDVVAEEPVEETEDVEITDFDEEAFDELGESYLKKVYDNVSSFKTTDGSISGNKLMLEGVITFNSGKSAKTKFVFESRTMTKNGKVKLVGLNEHISSNKNSFTLTGMIKDKKLLSESLNYNYGARSDEGKMKRLYGTVKRNVR